MEDLEYVIYCRKSTDESSNKQTQSIPDQIKRCVEYAQQNWLKIKAKPSDFSDFEWKYDVRNEDHDKEWDHREIYQQTRNLFIIKEQKSGKIPFKREKWNKLMKLIDQWKVKWLLCYSPDRQARNVVEWWMLINYVDEWKVDLKYTNFHFENTASGKMMLWMWFVFSKQYSDKLSEDVRRGNKSSASKWKAWWVIKYWYTIDKETWFHKPDWNNFHLMRRAFEMKLYEGKSDIEIIKRLTSAWFKKDWVDRPIQKSCLNNAWKDPFYFWIFYRSWVYVDLNEKNPFYKPLITKEEHEVLVQRYEDKIRRFINIKKKEEFNDISPIPFWKLIHKESNLVFSRYVPSIKRHRLKLEELQKTNPEATLSDVIKPYQIYYNVKSPKDNIRLEIRFSDINAEIEKILDCMSLTDEWYEKYKTYLSEKLEGIEKKKRQERKIFSDHINKLTTKKNKFILDNMGKKRTKDEQLVYEKQIEEFNKEIDASNENASKIVLEERNSILEFEAFVNIIENAKEYYKHWWYVRQSTIIDLLVSNIYVDNKKRLSIELNQWLEPLFLKKSASLPQRGVEPRLQSSQDCVLSIERLGHYNIWADLL